jgi:peptidoglycan/xylan/chitin deacetylase (PgdA/CDA1 family)
VILCYDKVAPEALTHWWVSADSFDAQLADLQAYQVVTLDQYDPANPHHVVISFDGTYANIATFALPLLQKWGYPFEAFVVGDWIGRDNTFDQHVEPPARFASLDDLDALVAGGGRLQWHTRTHGRLNGLPDDRLVAELTPDEMLTRRYGDDHFRWFAYPHGEHDQRVVDEVRSRFTGALSVLPGAARDRHALPRREAADDTRFSRSTVSVVIANYNYGRYLPEAVDSVLRQSRRPDELIIIDDGSDDGSQEVVERYRNVARLVFNDRNLGIVPTFRCAVEHTTGDYVVILGADNRMRADFIERCRAALDRDASVAVAYTDMALFGPRARLLAEQVGAVAAAADDVYLWEFPDPTAEALEALPERNFMHGSSMYRRVDYDRVGGYQQSEGPEDHNLFRRMVAQQGRRPARVPGALLEYRQHSGEQANTLLIAQLEVAHWVNRASELEAELVATKQARTASVTALQESQASLQAELDQARSELASLRREHGVLEAVNGELARRAELLAAIEDGGWWRLRGRLLPVLAPAAAALRRTRAKSTHRTGG